EAVHVVDGLDADQGVAEDALGVLADHACPGQEAARSPSTIVNAPIFYAAGLVERRLRLGKAVEGAGGAASENVRVARKLFLSADDLQRQRRQLEIAADALGALLHRHLPDSVP